MQRIDERVLRLGEINMVVALYGLVEEREPDEQHYAQAEQQGPAGYAGGFRGGYRGVHRKTGLRAAVTSSTRLVRVWYGAFFTICGSVSISCAMEIMASMKLSSSTLPSVSVGSIRSEEHTPELQSLRHLVCRL